MKNKKIADSGLRILEILKALSKSPLSMGDMLKLVANNEEIETVYTRETFNKYINTLRLLGFEIHKVDNKYVMTNTINLIHLTNENIRVLRFLRRYAEKVYLDKTNTDLIDFLDIVEKSLDEDTVERYAKHRRGIRFKDFELRIPSELVKKFQMYCEKNLKLKFCVNDGNLKIEYCIEPRKLKYEKEFVYLIGYDYLNDEFKKFRIKDIKQCRQLPQKSSFVNYTKFITYRVKNRLAKSYVLKENETVINIDNSDYLVISNTNEDMDSLFYRLLRYGENCEILYPKKVRDDFVAYIDKILDLYDEQ